MHVDKAKKRIAKQVKKGFKGYPAISLEYFGESNAIATEVAISFTMEEGETPQVQRFSAKTDVREDETIQSVLVKIIDRADAKSVTEVEGITLL